MTSDLNFADLILFGDEVGLKTRFYGFQKSLAHVPMRISKENCCDYFDLSPNSIFAAVARRQQFLASKTKFKIIIQTKLSANNCFALLTPSEDPFPNLEIRLKKSRLAELLKIHWSNSRPPHFPDYNKDEEDGLLLKAIDEIDHVDQECLLLIEGYYNEDLFPGCKEIIIPIIQKLKAKKLIADNLFPKVSSVKQSICSRPGCANTDNLKNCSICKQVKYCSTQCQSSHWKHGHKNNCKKSG